MWIYALRLKQVDVSQGFRYLSVALGCSDNLCDYSNSFFLQIMFDKKILDPKLRGKYNYKLVRHWGDC